MSIKKLFSGGAKDPLDIEIENLSKVVGLYEAQLSNKKERETKKNKVKVLTSRITALKTELGE